MAGAYAHHQLSFADKSSDIRGAPPRTAKEKSASPSSHQAAGRRRTPAAHSGGFAGNPGPLETTTASGNPAPSPAETAVCDRESPSRQTAHNRSTPGAPAHPGLAA